ncbi:RYamide receptor [Halyomorpha halys]|uniref:RYamide receptor n=1 Tax=Halyomorpha halys TaxID=286706 RepID=UPI0006D4D77F|nr:RYamide receptor-like isoform X1 [Halyomorpha halys]XP_014277087.1 RYamide receptor-like isoform X1 [Halyomorpha halys]XP_014277088.1 RYamide receptor-like isoform X1 [Halyomorpha halys]XP_014277089.1 RYamide receptor-like isoform X1 [Halyomorpha halys]XP_014277090.1 RYamide receptor-like isoform X1 [Halyomorpha halys]
MNCSNSSSGCPDEGELYEPLYEPPTYLTVFLSICYISISVAAVVGNGLVIWVILTSRRMRNVTNYYIANLALADIAVGLFAIPFEFQAALLQRWVLPNFMCPFCPFVKTLSISVSIFTLSAIALDRYRAILYPLTARASRVHFRVVISVIWIAGGVMAAPFAYGLRVTKAPVPYFPLNSSELIFDYCDNMNMPAELYESYRTTLVLLQYFLPLIVISYAYARVALTLWGSTAPGNAQTDRDSNIMRNKKKVLKVIKMLVIVVVLFALCWLPLQTYNVLQNITDINEYKYINIFWFGFDWLAMSNSCYNPFVYAIYNEKFKREFQLRLRAPCIKKKHRSDPLTRELSGFESSRFDWKRASTMKNGMPATLSVSLLKM